MSRQGTDGQPHLTYFDPVTVTSYVWDGLSDTIEVSPGGYGEPVRWTVPSLLAKAEIPPERRYGLDFDSVLASFRTACEDDIAWGVDRTWVES